VTAQPEGGCEFRGKLTEQQYCRIQWLASRKMILGAGLVMIAMVAMNLASGGAQVIARDPWNNVVRLIFVFGLGLLLIFGPRWQARRQYRSNKAIQGELSGAITDAGFEFRTEVGQARYRWDQVLMAKIATDVALIYTSSRVAFYLPQNFFASREAWESALTIVRKHVKHVRRA